MPSASGSSGACATRAEPRRPQSSRSSASRRSPSSSRIVSRAEQPDLVAQLVADGEQLAAAHEAGDPEQLRTAQRDLAGRSRRARPSRARRSVRCHRAAARGAAQGSREQSRHRGPATPRSAVGRGRADRLRCAGGPDTEPAEDASEARAQAPAGARTQAGTSRGARRQARRSEEGTARGGAGASQGGG